MVKVPVCWQKPAMAESVLQGFCQAQRGRQRFRKYRKIKESKSTAQL